MANTSVEVEFEAIPTYTLNIVSTGNGSVAKVKAILFWKVALRLSHSLQMQAIA